MLHSRLRDHVSLLIFELIFSIGWIPSMLPFGFWDTFFSTLDWGNLWKTIYYTAEAMIGQLLVGKL